MNHPPPPWHLRGNAMLRLQPLRAEHVRHMVPPEVNLVQVAPARTLGGIFLAQYGAGSTREYRELIVMPALVRRGGRVGAWISHIYVDDEESLTAGREVWGLPKQLASFDVHETADRAEVEVATAEGRLLCKGSVRFRRSPVRLPLVGPVITTLEDRLLGFAVRGTGGFAVTHWDLRVTGESPFAHLGLTAGRAFQLDHFRVTLPGPERLASLTH